MATDGRASFVILIYDEPNRIIDITSDPRGIGVIGFDAGDARRGITVLSSDKTDIQLEKSNVLRIDGNQTHAYR